MTSPPKPSKTLIAAGDIDEFGDLQRQIDLMAPAVARHKVLKEQFELALAGEPADRPVVVRGNVYELQLGPRRNERTIVAKKKLFALLKKRLGLDALIALISIPLGEGVDKNLTKSEQAGLVVEERSGWRSLEVIALHSAKAA